MVFVPPKINLFCSALRRELAVLVFNFRLICKVFFDVGLKETGEFLSLERAKTLKDWRRRILLELPFHHEACRHSS